MVDNRHRDHRYQPSYDHTSTTVVVREIRDLVEEYNELQSQWYMGRSICAYSLLRRLQSVEAGCNDSRALRMAVPALRLLVRRGQAGSTIYHPQSCVLDACIDGRGHVAYESWHSLP